MNLWKEMKKLDYLKRHFVSSLVSSLSGDPNGLLYIACENLNLKTILL